MNGTFSATILAGGTSKRFGKDKAFHLIESVPMWELQTRKVSQLMPSEIIISANEKQEFKTDLKIVIDSQYDEGPLRGLVDTLNATKAERMLLLAVDLPKMPINFLGELIYSGCGTIPVHKNGMTEPLAAVYPKSLIKLAEKNLQDNEILEEFKSDKENLKEMDQGNDINIGISKTNIEKENLSKKNVNLSTNSEYKKKEQNKSLSGNVDNFTKNIEYITSNSNGDIFKILAKFGKTNINNSNILDLEEVNGTISSLERSTIFITSDYGKYNYDNQNSKFYENVVVKYDGKIITCKNLDLNMSENIAVAYNDVIVKDAKSIMKAQIITMDIVTKDININSNNNVKIVTN